MNLGLCGQRFSALRHLLGVYFKATWVDECSTPNWEGKRRIEWVLVSKFGTACKFSRMAATGLYLSHNHRPPGLGCPGLPTSVGLHDHLFLPAIPTAKKQPNWKETHTFHLNLASQQVHILNTSLSYMPHLRVPVLLSSLNPSRFLLLYHLCLV